MTIDSITVSMEGPQAYASVTWASEHNIHIFACGGFSMFVDAKNAQWLADSLRVCLANRPAPPKQLPLPFDGTTT